MLERELPDVLDAFKAAGARRFDLIAEAMPETVADRTPRAGDERFVTYTARRSTIEWVLSRAAEAEPGVEIRRGVGATALETRILDGRVQVTAVHTDAGDRLAGDLVVDAMGRGSSLPKLLAAAGGPPVTEVSEGSGFLYYTRFFRGDAPLVRGPINAAVGTFSVLTLPGDGGTWSVTLYTSAGDRPLKAFRHEATWTAVARACPRHAHWLDGEPITPVLAMGGIVDRVRSLAGNGAGPALGVLSLGDAWACTNPSMGRGMTLGLAHAAILRRVLREAGDDPAALVSAYAAATEAELAPWYESTVLIDRTRMAQIVALRDGRTPPVPAPEQLGARVGAALGPAMSRDPDIFRAGVEIAGCLSLPREVFSRPGFAERVFAVAAEATPSALGPDRQELLTLVT